MCRWCRYIRSMRSVASAVMGCARGVLSGPVIDVEAAVDRRAVAAEEARGEVGLRAPGLEQRRRQRGFERREAPRGAEDHAGTRPRRAADLLPEARELRRAHPILRIQQDVAVHALRGLAREEIRNRREVGLYPRRALGERAEGLGLEIIRRRPRGLDAVPAPEGLPGEIILLERKLAGQAAQALEVEVCEVSAGVVAERVELRWRNAEAVEHRRHPAEHPHRLRVEGGCDPLLEEPRLVLEIAGAQHARRVVPGEPRREMQEADEAAEEAAAIETAVREQAEAPFAERRAAFPEGARLVVEVRLKVVAISVPGAGIDAVAEEAIEGAVIRQVLRRRQLESRQCEMCGVEVDGDDLRGIGEEIIEHVATAGGDRQHAARGLEAERFEVDAWILPDLVVDQAMKPDREEPFRKTPLARHAVPVDRRLQQRRRHAPPQPIGLIG